MARLALPYTTKTSLASMLNVKKAQLIAEKGGHRVLLREVEEELAEYCSLTREAIVAIKRGVNQPSLAVALKICEYFDCKVEDLFTLVEIKD